MDNIITWTKEDEAIIATNTDAAECKRCAVDLGYWQDNYIKYFVKHAERKAPEINRGYFARVKSIETFVHQFLERCGTQCQIINLGCGFDTLYWRLRDTTHPIANFVELDFPTVTSKKCHIIMRNKPLLEKLSKEEGEGEVAPAGGGGELHCAGYHLAGCDLRCLPELQRALAASGALREPRLPTLLVAECVLVYLRAEAGDALVRFVAGAFPAAALLLYEQCALADRFGAVMREQLARRGVRLEGSRAALSAAEGAERLRALGLPFARAWPLGEAWRLLPAAERERVERLEPLDEGELLQQLHAHYALTRAANHELLADLDLGPDESDP